MSSTKRVTFIEVALRKCQLSYGVAPCTAAIGTTGDQKCFNSRATCQDLANIDLSDEIVRFAKPSSNIRFDLDATPNTQIPNIQSVSYSPAVLDLGKSIGKRGSLTVTFKDHRSPDTDNSGDPYIISREYNPYNQGTYFGKLRARHPFLRGQSLWWIQGTSDQTIENMERRQFIIESTAGPDSNGIYTITAKDALKLTQGDRSTAPVLGTGFLQGALSAGATSLTLSPAGIGDVEYPSSGLAAVGGAEIVSFTRSGDVMTIVRGQQNTTAVDHDAESRVQLCLQYSAEKPSAILEDLLTNYARVPASYIPTEDWTNEADNQLNRVYSTVIAQPVAVEKLIDELLEQTASSMYWDGQSELVRWSVLKNPGEGAFSFDETKYQGGTFSIREQLGKRVSQVWVYYGQINPLLGLNEFRNYASSVLRLKTSSEDTFGGEPAYREIYSRWILGDARNTAETLGDLVLQRYSTPPRKIGFRILRDSLPVMPEPSGSYVFENSFIQDASGLAKSIPIQVTSVDPSDSFITVQAEEVTFTEIAAQDPTLINLYPANGSINYNIIDGYKSQTGQDPTALTAVNVLVESGFVIGKMLSGSGWPSGAVINIYNSGHIVGSGGRGGDGGSISYVGDYYQRKYLDDPTSGRAGGDGLVVNDTNVTVNIYNASGVIGGGGGGAGGSGAGWAEWIQYRSSEPRVGYPAVVSGSGGGGGAGYPAGSGGNSGRREITTENSYTNPLGRYEYVVSASAAESKAGLSGSTLSGGGGQGGWYHDNLNPKIIYGFNYKIGALISNQGTSSGSGGNLGQGGQSGDNIASSFGDYPRNIDGNLDTTESYVISGASGGAAGRAIVQNGNSVNIIETGTILGAIV